MRSANALKTIDKEKLIPAARYGEAASYRSVRWQQRHERSADWVVRKREVSPFSTLLRVIEESRFILRLPHDWDEMGSPAFSTATWERAKDFVFRGAELLWDRTGLILPAPRILPGPDGGIDLHWKTPQKELLVNVPEDHEQAVSYYGDNFGADKRQGFVESARSHLELFSWLTMTD